MRYFILVLGTLAMIGCGGILDQNSPYKGGDPSGADPADPLLATTGQSFSVSSTAALQACGSCPDWQPDPLLSYQTPSDMHHGVLKVELLRSETDPSPHALLELTEPRDSDLIAGSTYVDVDTGSIPQDTYTHMRVTLAYVDYTVAATGHAGGWALTGDLAIDYALSDYNDALAGPRLAGDYYSEFTSGTNVIPQAGTRPVDFPPSYPGATVDTSGGLYQVTFDCPQGPIVIDHDTPASVDVQVTFYVEDAFGWEEIAGPGNTTGVFDLSTDPTMTEQPAYLSVKGFAMEVL